METRLCKNVSIENDILSEDSEEFLVGLSTMDTRVDLTPSTARITIVDDNDGNNLFIYTLFIIFGRLTYYIHMCRLFT